MATGEPYFVVVVVLVVVVVAVVAIMSCMYVSLGWEIFNGRGRRTGRPRPRPRRGYRVYSIILRCVVCVDICDKFLWRSATIPPFCRIHPVGNSGANVFCLFFLFLSKKYRVPARTCLLYPYAGTNKRLSPWFLTYKVSLRSHDFTVNVQRVITGTGATWLFPTTGWTTACGV